MTYNLPSPMTAESVAVDVPSFIHLDSTSDSANPYVRLKFWCPARLDDGPNDYTAGRNHFLTALAYSRSIYNSHLLANIVGGMCDVGCGPIEMGFIDLLSTKATYGRLAPAISSTMAATVVQLCGHSEEELRFGEEEARENLAAARDCQCPEVIRDLMVDVVNRQYGYGALTFMWTVCGAAYLGAAN